MRSIRLIRFAVACVYVLSAISARAQSPPKPPPEAKGEPAPHGFSVVLVQGDGQSTTIADNVPAAARKALADMKDFLPYRGYRLLDASWILGSQRSSSRLRGPDEQEYQLTVVAGQQAGGRIQVRFQLQDAGALTVVTPRDADEAAARRAEEQAVQARLSRLQVEYAAMKQRLGEKHADVMNVGAEIESLKMRLAGFESAEVRRAPLGGRTVIDTTFSMDIGETVVVGTSRLRGGDKALIALLTAVPRGASAATRKE